MTVSTSEPEFEQVYNDLAAALNSSSFLKQHPEYATALRIAAIPERIIQFRVIWEDDSHQVQINQGYRVQFNSALGPYKGGIRFHPTVNLSVLKFLGFEQTFKNALTGLNIGGAKGGSDFDPKGKSDNEIRRFCVAFMRELSKYIGADRDCPSGDVGVGRREVGWFFGTYKAETSRWEGVITSKGEAFGGSLGKLSATGNGLVYYINHMISYASGGRDTVKGKRVAISGAGNVAQYAAIKLFECGSIVVSLSDSMGTIICTDEEGFDSNDIAFIARSRSQRMQLHEMTRSGLRAHRFQYLPGQRPWKHVGKVDIALPCATHNEVSEEEAQALISAGCRFVAEGSNMGCSQEAINLFERHRKENKAEALWFGPGKAANAGGSAVSGMEMIQNSQRISWTANQVDEKLRDIMQSCFEMGIANAKKYTEVADGELPSLVVGSTIAGFNKVATAMLAQGDWW